MEILVLLTYTHTCIRRQKFLFCAVVPQLEICEELESEVLHVYNVRARVHAWARRLALGGTKNDSYKVIKFSRAIGAWDNDAQCVKDIGTVYDLIHAYYVEKWKTEINRESEINK